MNDLNPHPTARAHETDDRSIFCEKLIWKLPYVSKRYRLVLLLSTYHRMVKSANNEKKAILITFL